MTARSIKQRNDITDFIFKIPESENIKVEISSLRDKRSVDQNRLYWLWLTCVEQETGTHRNFYHEHFKNDFLQKEAGIVFGKVVYIQGTTTSSDTKQFTIYLENIRINVEVELGIRLPDPKDLHWREFYLKYIDLL